MSDLNDLTLTSRIVLGLIFIGFGVFPMLATFDIGPLGQSDINGPPWLGFAAGGVFFAAGMAILVGGVMPLASSMLAIVILVSFAAIGNWIAFGAGVRACSGGVSIGGLGGFTGISGLGCRIPFGLGAVFIDGFLIYVCASMLQKALGGPPELTRTMKFAEWMLWLSLSPFLLILLIVLAFKVVPGVFKTRITTGAWPENKEFKNRKRMKDYLRKKKS